MVALGSELPAAPPRSADTHCSPMHHTKSHWQSSPGNLCPFLKAPAMSADSGAHLLGNGGRKEQQRDKPCLQVGAQGLAGAHTALQTPRQAAGQECHRGRRASHKRFLARHPRTTELVRMPVLLSTSHLQVPKSLRPPLPPPPPSST